MFRLIAEPLVELLSSIHLKSSYSFVFRSKYLPLQVCFDLEFFATELKCDLLFHWGLEDCKTTRGRRLCAQVCGVANIHRVEDLLHWQRGNSCRV